MKYLSLCSGIEAATVAWHPLGWEAVAYSEIERFPSEVLAHHYPNTPNLGDMTKFKEWSIESNIDVLVGGTPCQSFSVAGLRKGLDDPRGNLMLTYLAIADKYRPKWLVWENVPGVLSSNGGHDFASLLRGMGELGYGFAYRVLDAQYFGVAQRRRRVFVVGYLGDWRRAAAVLFERDSLCGNPAPSREKRQGVAPTVTSGPSFSSTGNDRVESEAMIPTWWDGSDFARTITTKSDDQRMPDKDNAQLVMQPIVVDRAAFNQGENAQYQFRAEHSETMDSLVARGPHAVLQPIAYNITFCDANGTRSDRPNGGLYVSETDVSSTMTKAGIGTNVAQPIPFGVSEKPDVGHCLRSGASKADKHESTTYVAQPICLMDQGGSVMNVEHDMVGTLRRETHGHEPIVAQPMVVHGTQDPCVSDIAFAQGRNNGGENVMVQSMAVRRLTPVECERLQGFPDSYSDIKSKGKATPDGPRYKALGNSMAVPVMAWIGNRIQQVENLKI